MRSCLLLLMFACCLCHAQTGEKVVASGMVPDEATKAVLLARLRELYGAERVVDQISIGNVVLPASWSASVQNLIQPSLKLVSKGQLSVEGNNVGIRGEVANEAQRQQIASELAAVLNPTYVVRNGLRVGGQQVLDAALGKRIIEFETAQAVLRPSGQQILDEMVVALGKVKGRKVEVIGHTDNTGAREGNLSLSLARAEAVRTYLIRHGIMPEAISVAGFGPDRPVAENSSEAGRARNRRIEFRVAD
jgi:OOP family OmpA-OmpF porin